MAISAQAVKQLKELTNCGMMDCKRALEETNGDVDAAIKNLREKGLAKAAKKSGRIAAEGLVYTKIDEAKKVGVVVEINVETDFAAKTDRFIEFVELVANTIIENDSDPSFQENDRRPLCLHTQRRRFDHRFYDQDRS